MPAIMDAPQTIRARKSIMWTRKDCLTLAGMGLLPERWELVQGEIISKMGTNLPHSRIAKRVDDWLSGIFPTSQILPTCSIDVAPEDNPTSEPEPDITVLNRPAGELTSNPTPSDIQLIIEVSDTSLDHDLGPKAKLYARAGVPEYWVVDINQHRIHQHRDPNSGVYTSIQILENDQLLSPLTHPESALAASQIFA